MIRAGIATFVLAAGIFLAAGTTASAQGNSNKQKDKKEHKKDKGKEYKEKEYKDKDYQYDERYEDKERRRNSGLEGIIGKVILPERGVIGPRQLQGVPKGHYPPPGECRVWYPNRPPGHQPPPTSCNNLRGIRLEPGAFILHGDRAYDAEYDWREEERRRPGSVGRDILDILFPNRY